MKIKNCLICNSQKLYRYYICGECYDNINFDVDFSKELKYVDEIVVSCQYKSLLREKIIEFKFQEKTYLYKLFAEIMLNSLFENELSKRYENISFVPMYKKDLLERGYNQSELIAKEIANNSFLNLVQPVKKYKRSQQQVKFKSLSDRRENIKNKFIYQGDAVDNIILVDDVITTGSTIDELARVYKENGSKKVAALIAATSHNL
ncbi:MAG: ComF family protein [Peptoniphilaceae bacterium]